MKTEKLSNGRRIVHALATEPEGLLAREIAARLGALPQTISALLWKLKQAGTVSHDKVTGIYKLTDVNTQKAEETKASKPIVQKVEIVEHQSLANKLRKQIDELTKGNAEVTRLWRGASESSRDFERKYFDALAVIAYLEARLAK
jgi:DNA-binding transcriptional regulator YhcF (GntR family)